MIDLRLIREQADRVRRAIADKGLVCDLDALLACDARRREAETRYNELRHEQKQAGEKIARASKEEKAGLSAKMGELKAQVKELEERATTLEAELRGYLLTVPQIPDDDAPVGPDASGNVEIRRVGEPRPKDAFGFAFRDHEQLARELGLCDFERGAKIAGARNYVLTGAGAMLHEAVLRLAFETLIERGFTPVTVPVLVTERLMEGTGFFPHHRDEVYLCERDEKALVGTAEVPITGLHADEILAAEELPRMYFGRSPCFRREAGAAGRDTRGLYRVHYFEKIELVVVCAPDPAESSRWHGELLAAAEAFVSRLELPYRVLEVCTGDMGQSKARQYDVEVWMPSRDAWGETHSASKYHDFQARRLGIRVRGADGKPQVCHTLNTTIAASPRLLIPLLESNQQADGSVSIPLALQPYMGGMTHIRPR